MSLRSLRHALTISALAALPLAAQQPRLTSPEQFFGHQIGADYVLPNYTKFPSTGSVSRPSRTG
jgi:hypothetical protein